MGSPSSHSTSKSTKTSFCAQIYRRWWLLVILLASLKTCQSGGGQKVNEGAQQAVLTSNSRSTRSADAMQEFIQSFEKDVIYLPVKSGNPLTSVADYNGSPTTAPEKDDSTQKNKFPFIPGYPASEYMLPYPRPGRSEDHLTMKLNNPTESQLRSEKKTSKQLKRDLLPFPRFGRSLKGFDTKQQQVDTEKGEYKLYKPMQFNEQVSSEFITPYPRIGKRLSESLLPHMRFGRLIEGYPQPYLRAGRGQQDLDEEGIYLTPYPRIGKKSSDSLLPYLRFGRGDGTMIPRMRFGRSSSVNDVTRNFYESITPYPRIGKKSQDLLLPYLRFGRQNDESTDSTFLIPNIRLGKKSEEFLAPQMRFGRQASEYLTPYPRLGKRLDDGTLLPYMRFGRQDSDDYDHEYLTPYPRLGKKSGIIIPDISNQEADDTNLLTPYPRFGKRSDGNLLPVMRFGRGNSDEIDISASDFITPYPRIGKKAEESLLPAMRFGRRSYGDQRIDDDEIYDLITPYPRIGKKSGETLIPYMRFGRQKQEEDSNPGSEFMTPYPRLGKRSEETLIPYLRFGKKSGDYLTPYPRLGKRTSDSLIPHMRFGRPAHDWTESHKEPSFVLKVQNDQAGNFGGEISSNMNDLSNKQGENPSRQGRSDSNEEAGEYEFDRGSTNSTDSEEQETLIPYPRFGRVPEVKSPSMHKLTNGNLMSLQQMITGDNKLDKNSDDTNYILPYPRPGRTLFLNSQNQVGRTFNGVKKPQSSLSTLDADNQVEGNNYMLPYLRPGRATTAAM